jgi:hypothetical protein
MAWDGHPDQKHRDRSCPCSPARARCPWHFPCAMAIMAMIAFTGGTPVPRRVFVQGRAALGLGRIPFGPTSRRMPRDRVAAWRDKPAATSYGRHHAAILCHHRRGIRDTAGGGVDAPLHPQCVPRSRAVSPVGATNRGAVVAAALCRHHRDTRETTGGGINPPLHQTDPGKTPLLIEEGGAQAPGWLRWRPVRWLQQRPGRRGG